MTTEEMQKLKDTMVPCFPPAMVNGFPSAMVWLAIGHGEWLRMRFAIKLRDEVGFARSNSGNLGRMYPAEDPRDLVLGVSKGLGSEGNCDFGAG
jgi:hypothetical protein